ncbi:Adaptor complexes medium subunit-like protein [Sarcoptes scabiei]|uniref:Adaptor complexes medium subunit-like protein n=1 Tax=Sarcoptes scabiei TaxID=52283 RepID=A0A132AI66_SARSC|nr:Adaptor complexes medium subunit-like protein [Sarcoptes scabiei]
MSNPFLADLEESYTPYTGSGAQTPLSTGRRTPLRRRSSTNPFEIFSPEDEIVPFRTADESGGVNANGGAKNLANAIADMSANFFESIAMKNTNDIAYNNDDDHKNRFDLPDTRDDDVFLDDNYQQSNASKSSDILNNVNNGHKIISTVQTIHTDGNGMIFDPFQTIHDDDVNLSSKRSSLEAMSSSQQQPNESTLDNNDDESISTSILNRFDHNENRTRRSSSQAKEYFHSSMNEIEMLASSNVVGNENDDQHQSFYSYGSSSKPENFLQSKHPTDIYSSDLSDLSESSSNLQGNEAFQSSALNTSKGNVDLAEESDFKPITTGEILLRRKSKIGKELTEDDDEPLVILKQLSKDESKPSISNQFDPFTTVYNDSPTLEDVDGGENVEPTVTLPDDEELQNHYPQETVFEDSNESNLDKLQFEEIVSAENVGDYVEEPSENIEGIVNDAFDEHDDLEQYEQSDDVEKKFKTSIDISEVQIDNIQSKELRDLIDNSNDDDYQLHSEAIKKSSDPFDTSAFDSEAFDAFQSRFEATNQKTNPSNTTDDPFASPYKTVKLSSIDDEKTFDTFEPFVPKQPENTPFKAAKKARKKKDSFEDSSFDDDDDDDDKENFRIIINENKTIDSDDNKASNLVLPLLPPPPKSPKRLPKNSNRLDERNDGEEEEPCEDELILTGYRKSKSAKKSNKSFIDEEFDRFFANSENRRGSEPTTTTTETPEPEWPSSFGDSTTSKQKANDSHSPASPQTPLYDMDTSQPLEDFPPPYLGEGWELMLRHPARKKLTANRYWKKIFVRFLPETCTFQLFNKKGDTQPFQELPLQASYSLSEMSPQQYDQYGKIFTIKIQYIFYRERVGVRPGQIAKVMQGQIQSMGDLARLGMPIEHAPQFSELMKLGTLDYNDIKELTTVVEEAMFRMVVHRDRALNYRTEEIQCWVQDECYVEQNKLGIVEKQLARVRIFFLAFLNGMPIIDVGINDLRRQGKEVVGRHDILPVVTEEWIRIEKSEFHSCVQDVLFETEQIIRLIPPDACQFEMMRFRIRPPKNRELPLQVNATMNITASKMELKCDILVPGCISRKHGQIPCENIVIRFQIPECWVYFFRVEKHFRYGAVHSTNRRSGKLKGFDRILGTAANPEPQLIEVTAGLAKYEHAYHSIVWRIPKLPKEGQGAYTQQMMLVRLPLSSFDRIPESFYDFVHVEFQMPSTTVSHTTLRSISVNCESPPGKYVRYVAKYEYKIGLNITYDEQKAEPEYLRSQ